MRDQALIPLVGQYDNTRGAVNYVDYHFIFLYKIEYNKSHTIKFKCKIQKDRTSQVRSQ